MSTFSTLKFTNKGLEIEAKGQAGKTINFSRFGLGDGSVSSENEYKTLTALKNQILSCVISKCESSSEKATLGFSIRNSDITNGFYWREIGLFAEDPDTKEEVLVLYANTGDEAEFLDKENDVFEKVIYTDIYMTNVESITATIDTSIVYASQNDLENVQQDLVDRINTKSNKKKTWNLTLNTTWTGSEAPYTKTVSVEGLLATDEVNLYPVYSNTLSTRINERDEYNKISLINSSDGSITITCDEEKPEIALNVRLEVVY